MEKYPHKIILGSKSPRRQSLLKELGFEFETYEVEVDESYPEKLMREEIPVYLAGKKCEEFGNISDDSILITSDTIVWLNGQAYNKPDGREEAIVMLKKLSGRMHEVITAICLKSSTNLKTFFVVTDVHFKKLTEKEIIYYVDNYKPFDKAGAYAIQEWIGYIGIEKINGSFYNVMGLPMKELYEELWAFTEKKVEAIK